MKKFKISNPFLGRILYQVKVQLYSIIANWNDIEFRNAILIIGSEEGSFYEPQNELIGNMVVVAIRNSLLEEASSINYKKHGLPHMLEGKEIKKITAKANTLRG